MRVSPDCSPLWHRLNAGSRKRPSGEMSPEAALGQSRLDGPHSTESPEASGKHCSGAVNYFLVVGFFRPESGKKRRSTNDREDGCDIGCCYRYIGRPLRQRPAGFGSENGSVSPWGEKGGLHWDLPDSSTPPRRSNGADWTLWLRRRKK